MQAKIFAKYKLLAIFLFAILPLYVVAQLNISAEYRPRTEL